MSTVFIVIVRRSGRIKKVFLKLITATFGGLKVVSQDKMMMPDGFVEVGKGIYYAERAIEKKEEKKKNYL